MTRLGMVRVGRWMSPAEYGRMVTTGRVQLVDVYAKVTRVIIPPSAQSYRAAPKGFYWVEFDVPTDCVKPMSNPDWYQIPGPGSAIDRLLQRQGQPGIAGMPIAENIMLVRTKV